MSNPNSRETVSFVFPRRSRGKHQDLRENTTNWFPKGSDIVFCYNSRVSLYVYFNSNKRIGVSGVNQTTEWLIYKVLFFILSASFSSTSCCFSSWITLKIVAFSKYIAWGFLFVLLCSFKKKKTGSVFPAVCHATFHHALITCCNVSQAGYNLLMGYYIWF